MEFNLAQVFSAVAAANPDRDCIVFGDRGRVPEPAPSHPRGSYAAWRAMRWLWVFLRPCGPTAQTTVS